MVEIVSAHPKYTDAEAVTAAKTVKLDDFTAPDDTVDLDASAALHGLMPKADSSKLAGIATGADVTGSNAPQAHKASHNWLGADQVEAGTLTLGELLTWLHRDWGNTDRLSVASVGSGAATYTAERVDLATGVTNPSAYTIYSAEGLWLDRNVAATNMGWSSKCSRRSATITASIAWFGLWEGWAAAVPVATEGHAAFKVVNGDILASSSDGTTEETTDLSQVLTQNTSFSFAILCYGDRDEFYMGVAAKPSLVATHSTKLATAKNMGVIYYISTSETVDKTVRLFPWQQISGDVFGS